MPPKPLNCALQRGSYRGRSFNPTQSLPILIAFVVIFLLCPTAGCHVGNCKWQLCQVLPTCTISRPFQRYRYTGMQLSLSESYISSASFCSARLFSWCFVCKCRCRCVCVVELVSVFNLQCWTWPWKWFQFMNMPVHYILGNHSAFTEFAIHMPPKLISLEHIWTLMCSHATLST